ncbi:hypothetical protein ACWIGI_13205 [Nocardia sp. NPDC055321]
MHTSEFESPARTVSTRNRRPVWLRGAAAVIAATAAVSFAGTAVVAAAPAPGAECLWAGTGYAPGTGVVAGGSAYTCSSDGHGAPEWVRGAAVGGPSTVANPGARTRPAGSFSAGAVQPGSEYTDYCVGAQLIDGGEQQYRVVARNGTLYWQAAGPIAQWAFDPGTGPAHTTRSASLCPQDPVTWTDSPVLWPQN